MREQSKSAKSDADDEIEVDEVETELSLDETENVAEEAESKEEKESFKPGAIPDGQLDATRLYLGEIGFSPLLTAEEEVHYSRLAQKGDESG
ncbi:MAG: sigma-70 factor domain-containing protein, partial [Thioalkalispiraceae bacterium]